MIDLAKLDADLLRDEGKVTHVYSDSLGNPTVGIGHKCIGDEALAFAGGISEEEIQSLYLLDRADAIKLCQDHIPGFGAYPEPICRGLANLAFNMGTRLLEFVHMLAAIELAYWSNAAEELLNSKADHQEPARLQRIADLWKGIPI